MVGISCKPPVKDADSPLLDSLGACPSCGYDLRGITANRCSECGTMLEFSVAVRGRALPWPVALFLVCLGAPLGLTVFLLAVMSTVWGATNVMLPLGPCVGVALPCLCVFLVGVRMVAWFETATVRGRLAVLMALLAFTFYEAFNTVILVGNHVMILA